MRRAGIFFVVALLALLGFWLVRRSPKASSSAVPPPPRSAQAPAAGTLAALAATLDPDAVSPIARELNAPLGSIQRDVEILHEVFVAWQTNFAREGNPVGDNAEITRALAGENRLRFAFIAPSHRAINARGEICDRWGTPFRFHALSGSMMEIWSAGQDRRFATEDDVRFAP